MAAKFTLFTAFLLGSILSASAAEAILPQGYTPERYERIWKKSPFTVASVLAPVEVDNTTFADSLTLVGLVTIGGKPLVTVVANDSQETTLIDSEKPNAAGLQVVSFVNDLDPSKVEVVLKKGDASGKLHFTINETPAAPQQPLQPQNNLNQPRRIIQPNGGGNIPVPTQPRVLPRNGAPVVVPGPGSAPVIRRRQLQLPGANRPFNNNQKPNVIPPP